jgi:acyl-CoA synthetase (AMP-forming)/AMP-acid ligase II
MIIDLFGSPNYASFDLSSLRYLSGGGAAMPQAVAERLQDEFGITFAEGYGLTETAAPSMPTRPSAPSCSAWASRSSASTRGWSTPATLQELPPGEVGEIVTRGPMVFKGYWRHPDATAGGLRRPRRQALLPHRRPGPHGRGRLFLHHRPAQAHDQRQRLQGVAQRGGAAAVQVPAGAGSLRDQQPRRTPTAARR